MALREILAEALKELDPALVLDAQGECALETEAGEELLIGAVEECGLVVFSLPLGTLPEEGREAALEEALAINNDITLSGPTRICYSRPLDALLLRYAVAPDGLTGIALRSLAASLIGLAAQIREHLMWGASFADEEAPPPAGEALSPRVPRDAIRG